MNEIEPVDGGIGVEDCGPVGVDGVGGRLVEVVCGGWAAGSGSVGGAVGEDVDVGVIVAVAVKVGVIVEVNVAVGVWVRVAVGEEPVRSIVLCR